MNQPLRFHALWSINGPLEAGRLRLQLDGLKAAGFDGVVFHPRFFPNLPPYLSDPYFALVSEAILHAKAIGVSFWIYDENGWPSGTVGGSLLRERPELAQRWLALVRNPPRHCLAAWEHAGQAFFLEERIGTGVDYLNPHLAPEFLRLTHEQYRARLHPDTFRYVEAFFCDEPEFGLGHAYSQLPPDGAVPWTTGLSEAYAVQYGESLLPRLHDLFVTGPASHGVRIRFWELLRDRFCAAFLEPMDAWCRHHGKRFTAHIKGEEHPLFQVPMVGSCGAVFRHTSIPGVDALERLPGNDYYPRQLVSAARQFGDGRCMAEAFGGAGWGARPEDLERYLLWLGGHGITDLVLHLSQYRLDSAAIRDWPPSQPCHLGWRDAYPEVLRRVRQSLTGAAAAKAEVLVVSPHRGIMATYEPSDLVRTNVHTGSAYPDSPAGRINRTFMEGIAALHASGKAWHVTDESTFERYAHRVGEEVRLGSCGYSTVLLAEGADLPSVWGKRLDRTATVRSGTAAPSPVIANSRIDLVWSLQGPVVTSLLLEVNATEDGFIAVLPWVPEGGPVELVFADAVSGFGLGETQFPVIEHETDYRVRLEPEQINAKQPVRFRAPPGVVAPFVWLSGGFRVRSETPFVAGPKTVATRGPFHLVAEPSDPVEARDLLAGGFPFHHGPIELTTVFTLSGPVQSFHLEGTDADAALVTVDGAEYGWVWGPDWRVDLKLPSGEHQLAVQLIPSSYNHFGPHHSYLGDRTGVSPDQFLGRKNFADPEDAPMNTLVPEWHFVHFHAPRGIRLEPV
ncbi:MAG: hypothetical protein U1F61_29910 [Opitutaceae bacterium]